MQTKSQLSLPSFLKWIMPLNERKWKWNCNGLHMKNQILRWMGLQWNICNTISNYIDHIWFHIKQQITKQNNWTGIFAQYNLFYLICRTNTFCIIFNNKGERNIDSGEIDLSLYFILKTAIVITNVTNIKSEIILSEKKIY